MMCARFNAKYQPVTETGCWLWTGAINKESGGYGWFHFDGHAQLAHRVSWQLHIGPIPKEAQVLHRCDTPLCVNPAHLFLGNNAANVADKVRKGRVSCGEKHNAKLTESQVLAIRAERGTIRSIGARYGVCATTIQSIRSKRIWRKVS
jgi:hypothetical protein